MGNLVVKNELERFIEELWGAEFIRLEKNDPIFKYVQMFKDIVVNDMDKYKPYLNTTENQQYMNELLTGKKAYTVLSSGDHVFNLLSHDILDITCVDTNPLQKFVFSLKCAGKRMLSRSQYEDFFLCRDGYRFLSKDVFQEVKKGFLKSQEIDKRLWEAIFKSTPQDELREFIFRGGVETNIEVARESLSYIKRNGSYARVCDNLEKANIKIYDGDAIKTILSLDETFDYIDFMGILLFLYQTEDYNAKKELLVNLLKVYKEKLNSNGCMILHYLFGTVVKDFIVSDDDLRFLYRDALQDLKDYFTLDYCEVRSVPGATPYVGPKDTVVYTRKK